MNSLNGKKQNKEGELIYLRFRKHIRTFYSWIGMHGSSKLN